jgi:hypothetical protein
MLFAAAAAKAAPKVKVSTGLVGVVVQPRFKEILQELYGRILHEVEVRTTDCAWQAGATRSRIMSRAYVFIVRMVVALITETLALLFCYIRRVRARSSTDLTCVLQQFASTIILLDPYRRSRKTLSTATALNAQQNTD